MDIDANNYQATNMTMEVIELRVDINNHVRLRHTAPQNAPDTELTFS